MNDTGIDGRATESDCDESDKRQGCDGGNKDQDKSNENNRLSGAYERSVAEFNCEKSIECASDGDSDEKHARIACGGFCGNLIEVDHIAARPEHCRRFKRAVCKKCDKTGDCAVDF